MEGTLTQSRMKAFMRCPRLEKLSYREGWRPIETSHALHFGTAWHKLRRAIWEGLPWEPIAAALDVSPVDRVKLVCLAEGYIAHWGLRSDVIAVEVEIRTALPRSDGSPMVEIEGAIDAITINRETQRVVIWDGKTTSEDLGDDSNLWARLEMDTQVSMYWALALAEGFEVESWVHDVVRKPKLSPLLATPPDKIKFKKDGTPYSNVRLEDETLEAFAQRLREDIAEDPHKYYRRKTIYRQEAMIEAHLETADAIAEAIGSGQDYMNTTGCVQAYGRCSMLLACGTCSHPADHPGVYRRAEQANEELEGDQWVV